jgi:hypothetical protein
MRSLGNEAIGLSVWDRTRATRTGASTSHGQDLPWCSGNCRGGGAGINPPRDSHAAAVQKLALRLRASAASTPTPEAYRHRL